MRKFFALLLSIIRNIFPQIWSVEFLAILTRITPWICRYFFAGFCCFDDISRVRRSCRIFQCFPRRGGGGNGRLSEFRSFRFSGKSINKSPNALLSSDSRCLWAEAHKSSCRKFWQLIALSPHTQTYSSRTVLKSNYPIFGLIEHILHIYHSFTHHLFAEECMDIVRRSFMSITSGS